MIQFDNILITKQFLPFFHFLFRKKVALGLADKTSKTQKLFQVIPHS
jgi:hypothetical protein